MRPGPDQGLNFNVNTSCKGLRSQGPMTGMALFVSRGKRINLVIGTCNSDNLRQRERYAVGLSSTLFYLS